MRVLSGRQRIVYPCKEFDPVEIPLDALVVGDSISIYADTDKYFDMAYRGGRLVVSPKSNVGFIPINDSVAIQVSPRFPIDNLFYILKRSSAVLRFIDGYVRSYDFVGDQEADPIELLAGKFSASLQRILANGVLKRYVTYHDASPFSGSLDLSETISLYLSKGINYRQSWFCDELSENVFENSMIKSASSRVIDYFAGKTDLSSKKIVLVLRKCLKEFDFVTEVSLGSRIDETSIARLVQKLPNFHREYATVIWLAYLILARRGLAIESAGKVSFDTFVVNMAAVFEDYVRSIVRDFFHEMDCGYSVVDGNKDGAPLFSTTTEYTVKPDVYLKENGKSFAVIDMKYKPDMKSSDRYEVLAFCEALQVKRAIIVSPGEGRLVRVGMTAGGIEMYSLKINISATDMPDAERSFLRNLELALKVPEN